MDYLKKIGFGLLYTVSIIIVLTFLVTLFNYIGVIKHGFLTILEIIIPCIGFFIGGFEIGKRSKQKGWLEGIKFSGILLIIIFILNLIFKNSFEIKNILYYLILLTLSTTGSIIGINKNKS